MRSRHILAFPLAVCLLLGPCRAYAQNELEPVGEDERSALIAGDLLSDFRLDGLMDDPVWSSAADSISTLVTIEPVEGGIPDGRTIVKVVANAKEIVVGAWCYENEPDRIVAFSKARDSELTEEDEVLMLTAEDYFMIVLDTFLDGRSGYVFAVNPSGARFDGLVIEQGEDVNRDWDTIWEARTSRDHEGWYVEMRIPIKSLSFRKYLSTWGFNVQRRVQRLQETSRWSGANVDFEFYQTNLAGELTGLPAFDLGMGLSVRPALAGAAGKPGSGESVDLDGDISLEVTQNLGPNLLAALTVNTDFAETEVDARQINLTRFPLFFPEKRTFFLEGADIFEFGMGLDEDNLLPFFSRRIGLVGFGEDDQAEIPINAGGKINGRVGNTNLGALVVNTREMGDLEIEDVELDVQRATMGALRIKQNILEESELGFLTTFGDQLGRSGAWTAGVDVNFQTSNFLDEKNLLVGAWGLLNDRDDLDGDKTAFGFRVEYPSDLWSFNSTTYRIGDAFEPSLGFVPRNNVFVWDFGGEYKPRPASPLVRQMFHELTFTLFNDRNNTRWESYSSELTMLDWLLESGDRITAGLERMGDRPPEVFEISDGAIIPADTYEWTRFILGASTARKRRVSGGIQWEFGNFYNGDLSTVEASIVLKPSSFFTIAFTLERNTGAVMALPDDFEETGSDVPGNVDFIEELYGIRLQFNFSPDLHFSSFTQYETESRELGANNRLRWTFSPLGDLFIVYNHSLERSVATNRWDFVAYQLPVKIQYTQRF